MGLVPPVSSQTHFMHSLHRQRCPLTSVSANIAHQNTTPARETQTKDVFNPEMNVNQQQAPVGAPAVDGVSDRPRAIWFPLGVLLFVAVWIISHGKYYTPGDNFGYWIGVAGGSMMLILLAYPLRKYVRAFRTLGALPGWFKLHMIFGIGGPVLILLHSTFHLGSLNATVAFVCMLLVAGSGIVGRFIYRHIHHGLYGRHATLQEMQMLLGNSSGEVRSKLHFAPEVEAHLRRFETAALAHPGGALRRARDFLLLPWRANLVYLRCRFELSRFIAAHAKKRGWPAEKLAARRHSAHALVRSYLFAVQRAAQFGTYERLFSLWHIAHIPFVYLLAISGVFHVIAVHMY
jgi:hypothetical protein